MLYPQFALDQKGDLSAIADAAIEKCRDASYRPSCYDREIPKLTEGISMGEAFKVTKIVQNNDSAYAYCHVLGHELAAREVRIDPSNWKDVLIECPKGQCSNGCLHGGLQEKFRGAESLTDQQVEALLPEFASVCEARPGWNPTGLEYGSCYHAMGHLAMYAVSAEISKAIDVCDKIAVKSDGRDYRVVCYDGVFMQMFQPLEPEDFALVQGKVPTKETVDEYCANFPGWKKASCQNESWPLFSKEIITPSGLITFCSKVEEGYYRDRCFKGLFYIVTSQFNLNLDKMNSFCSEMNSVRQGECFAGAASRFIEVDYDNIPEALSLCETASKFGVEENCYEQMIQDSTFSFHRGSEEYYKLCNSMPTAWRNKCLIDEKG